MSHCIQCDEHTEDCRCRCEKCDEHREWCDCNYGFNIGDVRPQTDKKQAQFTGTPSGYGGCFCWDVTEEEHLRFFGQEEHDNVIRAHVTSRNYQRAMELGIAVQVQCFRIFPHHILEACAPITIPCKVTMTIEEAD